MAILLNDRGGFTTPSVADRRWSRTIIDADKVWPVSPQWYSRKIQVPSAYIGKTINQYIIACENDATAEKRAFVKNIRVTDVDGNVRFMILKGTESGVVTTLAYNNPAGSVLADFERSNTYGAYRAVFEMAGSANSYAYYTMGGIPGYTFQAGDYVQYDIWWLESDSLIALDLGFTDSSVFRASGAVDQNGLGAHPATSLYPYTGKPYGYGLVDLSKLMLGVNFILNGGFATDLTGWSAGGAYPPAMARVTAPVKVGAASMQLTAPAASSGGTWYDTNYKYRKAINIAGSAAVGTQTNVVKLLSVFNYGGTDGGASVYVNGYCRSDFHDLRFTLGDAVTPVKHFVWSVTGSVATVLLQMPSVPAAGTTFYVYYGYASAADASDSSLFLKYDSMSPYSTNFVNNGSFEDGSTTPAAWGAFGGATATKDTTHVHEGSYAAKLVGGGPNTGMNTPISTYYDGKEVTVGCWIWCDTPNTARITTWGGAYSAYHPGDSQWHFVTVANTIVAGNEWAYCIMDQAGVTAWFDGYTGVLGATLPANPTYPVWAGSAYYDPASSRVVLNTSAGQDGSWLHYLNNPGAYGIIYQQAMTGGADSEFAFGQSSDSFPTGNDNSNTGFNFITDEYSGGYTRVDVNAGQLGSGALGSLADGNYHTMAGLVKKDQTNPTTTLLWSMWADGVAILSGSTGAIPSGSKFGWNARSGGMGATHILGASAIFQSGAFSVSSYGAQEAYVPSTGLDCWSGEWRTDYAMYRGRTVTFQAWLQCPTTNGSGAKCCLYDGTQEEDDPAGWIPGDGEWHLSQITMTVSDAATSLLCLVRLTDASDVVYVNNAQMLDDAMMAGDIVQHDGSLIAGIRAGSIGMNLISNDLGNLPGWGYPP